YKVVVKLSDLIDPQKTKILHEGGGIWEEGVILSKELQKGATEIPINPGHNPGNPRPRFKDKEMDRIYQGLLGKTPEKLIEMKIFGSIHALFKMGYEGKPLPYYCPRGTAAYAAYVAGKESDG
ncbi:hypothetical protein LCGC14_2754560, partial [marine sediment metagenome]